MNLILVIDTTGLGYNLIPSELYFDFTSQLMAKLPVPLSPVKTAVPFCTFKQVALLLKVTAMLLLDILFNPPTLLIIKAPVSCWACMLCGKADPIIVITAITKICLNQLFIFFLLDFQLFIGKV
jgi:hypothetical protein